MEVMDQPSFNITEATWHHLEQKKAKQTKKRQAYIQRRALECLSESLENFS